MQLDRDGPRHCVLRLESPMIIQLLEGGGGNIVGSNMIGGRESDCLVRFVLPDNLG